MADLRNPNPARQGPLAGIRVVDLSRFISGPYCGMLLGDMGADVVKVESAKGEDTRHFPPRHGDDSLYTMMFNRNKRGIVLDLRESGDQKTLRRLIAEADIVIENFVPGVLEKMGCGWEVLSAENPRLILARISGFGQTGPTAQRPCFDAIAQAMSGIMDLTGRPEGEPVLTGTYIIDTSTALYTTIGVLAALQARARTGRGQIVEATLMDTAISFLSTTIPDYDLHGVVRKRNGNRDRYGVPANSFPTKDGDWVHILVLEARFLAFIDAMGRPELAADPRFATQSARLAHIEDLEAIVRDWTLNTATAEILAALERIAVPHAKIATVADVLANEQLRHRGSIIDVPHPAGSFKMAGFPVRLGDTPLALHRTTPGIGEHTEEVLDEWLRPSLM